MVIHTVKPGESVYSIARQYGVSASRVLSDNGISAADILAVGQALLILFPSEIYTVQSGDSLYTVAQKTGVSVGELRRNNPELIASPVIYPGQQLTIRFSAEKRRTVYTNGYAYPNIDRGRLAAVLPYLSRLTVFGYGFREDGSLISINDLPLIEAANAEGTAPILLFSTITEDGSFSSERASLLLRNTDLQSRVIDALISTMQRKGYRGIDVDFEYIAARDADAFLFFLQNMTDRMHAAGYPVHVDLAPKTYDAQPGLLYEAHNYTAIGRIVDTVLLMTYEWGYTYGPPMAVAPIGSVRRVAEYAVSVIEPDRIFLGIPNYGYDWTLPYVKGSAAANIGNSYAVRLAAMRGADIRFDEAAASPFFEYYQNNQKHVVWFEDVRSIAQKYALLDSLSLYGAGYWTVMRPFRQNWMYINALYHIGKSAPAIRL